MDKKYQFTRISSYNDEPVTIDQDGWRVQPKPMQKRSLWVRIKCRLTLFHFGGGVRQGDDGHWYCKRCGDVSI